MKQQTYKKTGIWVRHYNTEAKTSKMKKLDEQVVVTAENTTGHNEGAAAVNANYTEGAPQAGPWGA